jgi:hypothetical protein
MSTGCGPFRLQLDEALAGPRAAFERLAAHPHLGPCAPCRAEYERERRLESLLDRALPLVAPPALARAVLDALARASTGGESAGEAAASELDDLLERLPSPRTPAGLARRVLVRVAEEHAPPRRRRAPRLWLVAAVLLAAVTLGWWLAPSRSEAELELARNENLESDEELVAYAVENWELLNDEDLDVWLAGLDPLDELLIEMVDEEWLEEAGPAQPAAEHGKSEEDG